MIRFRRILCPTDLSISSDQAVGYSLALAQSYDAHVTFCYCAGSTDIASVAAIQKAEVEHALTKGRIKELFEGALLHFLSPEHFANLSWEGVLLHSDDVGEAITNAASEREADLIVMRSRRRPHRAAILGSTAESVCRSAPCPVFVTHSDERDWIKPKSGDIELKRVLIPYDFSDYAELALRYALSFAQEYQAELHLLHVLPPNTLTGPEVAWYPASGETSYQTAARRLQKAIPSEAHLWCQVKTAVSQGLAYREVLAYAEKHEIDLISIGAHGAGFGMRALFGSNVDRVLRQAKCPVLVARPLKPKSKNDD
jgi:nucleotide-binding universal stress UspA family protein